MGVYWAVLVPRDDCQDWVRGVGGHCVGDDGRRVDRADGDCAVEGQVLALRVEAGSGMQFKLYLTLTLNRPEAAL